MTTLKRLFSVIFLKHSIKIEKIEIEALPQNIKNKVAVHCQPGSATYESVIWGAAVSWITHKEWGGRPIAAWLISIDDKPTHYVVSVRNWVMPNTGWSREYRDVGLLFRCETEKQVECHLFSCPAESDQAPAQELIAQVWDASNWVFPLRYGDWPYTGQIGPYWGLEG